MELSKVKNKLSKDQYHFFLHFQKVINTKLYFIGSILRYDYFPGNSDLDIEIFSENVNNTFYKIIHFFHYMEYEPLIFVFTCDNQIISGYKGTFYYKLNNQECRMDVMLYNHACKNLLLKHRMIDSQLPFYSFLFLTVLKMCYYYLHLFDSTMYTYLKRKHMLFINPNKTLPKKMNLEQYKMFYYKVNQKYLVDIL
jgi:hypothetical protein